MKLFELHETTVVYLDLDETLIHTSQYGPIADEYVEVSAGFTSPRPHMFDFLDSLKASGYNINLMTYGTRTYASEVLDKLGIRKYFNQVLAREDILEIYETNKSALPSGTLVDNEMPFHKVNLVYGKKIKVSSWTGQADDRELLRVLRIL